MYKKQSYIQQIYYNNKLEKHFESANIYQGRKKASLQHFAVITMFNLADE